MLYFRELVSRKETILASIQEQGKLTDELKARIDQTLDKSELEDLYLPYKPKRRTKAMIAREKGLEPLADYLWNQQPTGTPLETFAASFVDAEKGVASVEEALEGARHIVAETISDDADIRKLLRHAMFEEGVIVSKKTTDAVDEQQKFKMYYDYREPVKQIPSHRMLAIRRGETENVLYFLIELDPQRPLDLIKSKIHKQPGDWTPQLEPGGAKTPGSVCSTAPSLPKSAWNSSSAPTPMPSRFSARISRTCCWPLRRANSPYSDSTPASAPAARSPSLTTPASFSPTTSSIRSSPRTTSRAPSVR